MDVTIANSVDRCVGGVQTMFVVHGRISPGDVEQCGTKVFQKPKKEPGCNNVSSVIRYVFSRTAATLNLQRGIYGCSPPSDGV